MKEKGYQVYKMDKTYPLGRSLGNVSSLSQAKQRAQDEAGKAKLDWQVHSEDTWIAQVGKVKFGVMKW